MTKNIVNIEFFDTTLRDGAQSLPEANQFETGIKPEAADSLAQLGVQVIEAGFPATPSDAEEVYWVAKTVGQKHYKTKKWPVEDSLEAETVESVPVIAGLSRAMSDDIETAWQAISQAFRPRIHTFISTDEQHMHAKFPGLTQEEVLNIGLHAIKTAKELTSDRPTAQVEFSAEAATTTDSKFLERVVKGAVEMGVDVINVPDTVGQKSPFRMYYFYGKVMKWALSVNKDVTISAHNHNDLGNATANSLALVQAATDYSNVNYLPIKIQLETSICGLGERAGNADIFPIVAGLFKFSEEFPSPTSWQFNPERSRAMANRILGYAGLEVDRQSPIVGRDINVHRSGIHSNGVIKGGYQIYTPIDPQFWGHSQTAVHEDGKYQGRAGRLSVDLAR